MKTIRRAGVGLAATAAIAGIGLSTGLPATVAEPRKKVSERAVTRQQAARIADRTIERRTGKSARVTGVYREDDYGARWEVEVTLRNGREFDVYVNRSGRVVKVIRKAPGERNVPRRGTAGQMATVVDLIEAVRIAEAYVEELTGADAEAIGADREDDDGARWSVELSLANGTGYELYLSASGEVIQVEQEEDDD